MATIESVSLISAIVSVIAAIAAIYKIKKDSKREDTRLTLDQEKGFAGEARLLLEEKKDLYKKIQEYENEIDKQRIRINELTLIVQRLERAIPLTIIRERLEESSTDLAFVLDECQDLFVISSTLDGGTFLWVNAAWERLLGWTKEELLGTAWKNIVDPAFLTTTRHAETGAWVDKITVVNRYKTKDGHWAHLRWFASRYSSGITLALARVEGMSFS